MFWYSCGERLRTSLARSTARRLYAPLDQFTGFRWSKMTIRNHRFPFEGRSASHYYTGDSRVSRTGASALHTAQPLRGFDAGTLRPAAGQRYPTASMRAPCAGYQLPPDYVIVAIAGALLAGAGFMLRSLGDVIGEESRLPSASSAKTRRELYGSRRYLQKKPPRDTK